MLCPAGLVGPACLPGLPALLDIVPGTLSLHLGVSSLSATRQPTRLISHPGRPLGCSSQLHRTSQAQQHPEKGFISEQQLHSPHSLHLGAIGRKLKLTVGLHREPSLIRVRIDSEAASLSRTRQLRNSHSFLRVQTPGALGPRLFLGHPKSTPASNEPSTHLPTAPRSRQCSQLEDPRTCDSPVPLLGSVEAEVLSTLAPQDPGQQGPSPGSVLAQLLLHIPHLTLFLNRISTIICIASKPASQVAFVFVLSVPVEFSRNFPSSFRSHI